MICRRASFAFVPAAHTIRLEYVRPSRTIDAVERAFSTIFCALDALSRVEPAIASGPVFTSRRWSASGASGAAMLLLTRTVSAPAARAPRSAPATNGVRPLAVKPTATSLAPSPAAAAAPSASSSSAVSTATATASEPPAW